MEESLFQEWVNKYFPGITVRVVQNLNDTQRPQVYWHRRMLSKLFSVSGKWESVTSNNHNVAADVVAMDASLPLKSRPSISKFSGDIPKMGMELTLNETQLTNISTMMAMNVPNAEIMRRVFEDTPRVIQGVWERNELTFLRGLSTGVALAEDADNVGTGIRIDYGFQNENKFNVDTLWTNVASTPLDDIEKIRKKAQEDGNTVGVVLMDRPTFDNFAKTTQVKEKYAFNVGFVGDNVPAPDLEKVNSMLLGNYGFTIQLVERSVKVEKNGVRSVITPWAAGQVVFMQSENIGNLVWARLAEMDYPVSSVTYQTVDDFILASKYRKTSPLKEFTSSQARVVPIINNVDEIYHLDTTVIES
ncbi:major capsid protein [Pleomorphovibrio marinus]|uniref:major capsid protein n=1 Tax=Pleomorphovibrio marinus TaxID=2164132 RepID=UPI000E0A6C9B|nr:major capsid protein [Pleomorphovibrio marinus]